MNYKLSESWNDVQDIIVFGLGKQGKKVFDKLKQDFNIIAIIDNNLAIKEYKNIPVIKLSETDDCINHKIIVTMSEYNYSSAKKELIKKGLLEFEDFCNSQTFVSEWYLKNKQELCVIKTDIFITSLCSLKCKDCMMQIPYFKEYKTSDFETVKQTVDNYFATVDYVFDMDIVGGEPFLNDDIINILQYIDKKYRSKIAYLGVITNGTIIPSDKDMLSLKDMNIGISLSDYSLKLNNTLREKIEGFINKCDEYNIKIYQNTNIDWFDFGFRTHRYNYSGDALKMHAQICNPVCHMIYNNKFYYCGVAWAAEKSGYTNEDFNNCVDLTKTDKDSLYYCSIGRNEKGYLNACACCGGFGIDNNNLVETGVQI